MFRRRSPRALSDAAAPRARALLIPVGLSCFAIGSLVFGVIVVEPFREAMAAQTWVDVPCTILESRVGSSISDGSTLYRVEVRYAYRFPHDGMSGGDPVRYESTRYDFSGGSYSSDREPKAAEVRRLTPGLSGVCKVDPEAPAQAVLVPGVPADMWIIAPLVLLFPMLGGGLTVAGVVDMRRGDSRRQERRPLSHAAADPPSRRGAHGWAGALELSPGAGRRRNLGLLVVFCAIWNGVTWSVLLSIVAAEGAAIPTFGIVMLSIFALIGVGTIGAAVHAGLALTNPTLNLTLSRRVLHTGEPTELAWRCKGDLYRCKTIAIDLEGRESATYRRGTDTVTETHVFARLPIATLDGPVAIESGRTHVTLPPNAVPTIVAPRNSIRWHLRVRGSIPRWPDIADEYELTVLPPAAAP
jgi:hypothetical protein